MGRNRQGGIRNPKNRGLAFKVSDRRWNILTDYADKHDRTMTSVIEELIDLLEKGVIERDFVFNSESGCSQPKKKPFESTVNKAGAGAVAQAASESFVVS